MASQIGRLTILFALELFGQDVFIYLATGKRCGGSVQGLSPASVTSCGRRNLQTAAAVVIDLIAISDLFLLLALSQIAELGAVNTQLGITSPGHSGWP